MGQVYSVMPDLGRWEWGVEEDKTGQLSSALALEGKQGHKGQESPQGAESPWRAQRLPTERIKEGGTVSTISSISTSRSLQAGTPWRAQGATV